MGMEGLERQHSSCSEVFPQLNRAARKIQQNQEEKHIGSLI